MRKIFEVIKIIIGIIFGIFIFALTGKNFSTENKKDEEKANQAKEEKENELKEKDAADIVADSPNQSTISNAIQDEKDELRERIRNRLNQDL